MASRALKELWELKMSEKARDFEERISRILRKQIDREILELAREQGLREQGWHVVIMPAADPEVRAWLAGHCQGGVVCMAGRAVFERAEEATAARLTWG